jgi:hypothetical protein
MLSSDSHEVHEWAVIPPYSRRSVRGESSFPFRLDPEAAPWAQVRLVGPTILAVGLLAVSAAPAHAAWAPGASVASASGALLGDDRSTAPLLSADGRYVVFSTSASVLLGDPPNPDERYSGGLVRKDLSTGEVAIVAPPQRVLRSDGTEQGSGTGAGEPLAGISADGRYVLFGTRARLANGDGASRSPDVYVRDMTQPASGAGSYELVSARDGSVTGADYADAAIGSTPGFAGYALSADGRRAVFVSAGASNLPDRATPATPARQTWVRDLDARTTRLVSRRKDDGSAVGAPAVQPTGKGTGPATAMISGDGTKVVWTAGNAETQTPTLPAEGTLGIQSTLLWRDLATPTAPARRVAGAVDLDDPACSPGGYAPSDTAVGPCYGPFVNSEGTSDTTAGTTSDNTSGLLLGGVSADGMRVLFTSSAFRRPLDRNGHRADTGFLADMRPGVRRKDGVTVAWSYPNVSTRKPIANGRLAPDGRHAVFVSRDIRFDGLQNVGPFPTGSLQPPNAFAVDLDARTVELATRAADGGDYATESQAAGTGSAPSVAADGSAVAFDASDGNLFLGDANGVEDVLVVRTVPPSDAASIVPAPPTLPAPPTDASRPQPLPSRYFVTLGRVTVSRRTGTATLRVSLPVGGTLTAKATGTAKRTVRRNGRRRTTTTRVAVGSARRTMKRAGTFTITVKVGAKARAALRRSPYKLAVRLGLSFRPQGAAPTTATRSYTLRRASVTPTRKSTTKATTADRRTR